MLQTEPTYFNRKFLNLGCEQLNYYSTVKLENIFSVLCYKRIDIHEIIVLLEKNITSMCEKIGFRNADTFSAAFEY